MIILEFAPHTFIYDGFYSEPFGLRFAHFDTSEPLSVGGGFTYNMLYIKNGHRRIVTSANQTEDNCLEFEVEFMAENGLYSEDEDTVYDALFNKPDFKKLQIYAQTDELYYFNCLFTNPEKIQAIKNNRVATVGYKCNLVLDSSWMWKDNKVTLSGSSPYRVNIETQIKDYTWPIVTIVTGNASGNIQIINMSDNDRITKFTDIPANSTIVMNPEYHTITFSGSGNIWHHFDIKHFLRMLPGKNDIAVTGNISSIKLEYKEAHIL